MNRATGSSVLVFGIVLGVAGAIMAWAVTADAEGFDITAGMILFWVGVLTTIIGLALLLAGDRSTTVRRRDTTMDGDLYEEEHRSSM